MKSLFILLGSLFILVGCNNSEDKKVAENVREGVPAPTNPYDIQNFEMSKKYSSYSIYIKALQQEMTKPEQSIFPVGMDYILRLNQVSIKVVGDKLNIEVSGGYALTNIDYSGFKIYNVQLLKINGKNYNPESLKGKKFVIYLKDEKLIYSLEER
ncbi:MAG: hypothetical protein N2Z81_07365 [Hydrogenothermaceae bacterium]|nr:hypothetical protein [Hydrogenothermaceae bacterium]